MTICNLIDPSRVRKKTRQTYPSLIISSWLWCGGLLDSSDTKTTFTSNSHTIYKRVRIFISQVSAHKRIAACIRDISSGTHDVDDSISCVCNSLLIYSCIEESAPKCIDRWHKEDVQQHDDSESAVARNEWLNMLSVLIRGFLWVLLNIPLKMLYSNNKKGVSTVHNIHFPRL